MLDKQNIVYTAEQLTDIGKLLRNGDMARIAKTLKCNYNNVVDTLTGKRGKGVTTKAKVALAIVDEAKKIIAHYANEIEKDIAAKQYLLYSYRSITASNLSIPKQASL